MTNLEYLRMKIPDKSAELFTDEELLEIIKDNSLIRVIKAEVANVEKTIWRIPYRRIDEEYPVRVYVGGFLRTTNSATFPDEFCNGFIVEEFMLDRETGTITFPTTVVGSVFVQAKVINWNDVLADCYEMIMGDFRKLASYNVGIASQSMDDIKAHLRMLVQHYRSIRGAEL